MLAAVRFVAVCYLGVLVLLTALENRLLYYPMRDSEGWVDPAIAAHPELAGRVTAWAPRIPPYERPDSPRRHG